MPMTLTDYAKRRGCTKMAVSTAIKSGRLVKSVVWLENGRPAITDAMLADEEWRENTDLTRAHQTVRERAAQAPSARGSAEGADVASTMADAALREKHWRALKAELEYKQAAGELVPAAEVRGKLEETFHACRTRLLGVPSRVKQALPELTPGAVAKIDELIREALEDLAAGAAP
jgi:phage terminase Nu1 subunit (DNA packaging protein)